MKDCDFISDVRKSLIGFVNISTFYYFRKFLSVYLLCKTVIFFHLRQTNGRLAARRVQGIEMNIPMKAKQL